MPAFLSAGSYSPTRRACRQSIRQPQRRRQFKYSPVVWLPAKTAARHDFEVRLTSTEASEAMGTFAFNKGLQLFSDQRRFFLYAGESLRLGDY